MTGRDRANGALAVIIAGVLFAGFIAALLGAGFPAFGAAALIAWFLSFARVPPE
jgi:hypothetical protein